MLVPYRRDLLAGQEVARPQQQAGAQATERDQEEPSLQLGLAARPVDDHEEDATKSCDTPKTGNEILEPRRPPRVVTQGVPGVVLAGWHVVWPGRPGTGALLGPMRAGEDLGEDFAGLGGRHVGLSSVTDKPGDEQEQPQPEDNRYETLGDGAEIGDAQAARVIACGPCR